MNAVLCRLCALAWRVYEAIVIIKSQFFEYLNSNRKHGCCWVYIFVIFVLGRFEAKRKHTVQERRCMELGNQSLHAGSLTTPSVLFIASSNLYAYPLSSHSAHIGIPIGSYSKINTDTDIEFLFTAKFRYKIEYKTVA